LLLAVAIAAHFGRGLLLPLALSNGVIQGGEISVYELLLNLKISFPFLVGGVFLRERVLPLEVGVLLEEGHKEAASVLVVGQDAHGVVEVNLVGSFQTGSKH
jgi:hypothetical protein